MADREHRARNLYVSEENERSRQRIAYLPLHNAEYPGTPDNGSSNRFILIGLLLAVSFAAVFLASSRYVRTWVLSRPAISHWNDASELNEDHHTSERTSVNLNETRSKQDITDALATLLGAEKPRVTLWQVINGPVLVRKKPSLRSGISDRKPSGTLVVGIRENSYIRLATQRGYMKTHLANRNMTLMRPLSIPFLQISWGNCSSQAVFDIKDRFTCQAAGLGFGLSPHDVGFSDATGCQTHANASRQLTFCCQLSCAPPTTTTSTFTTTTTSSTSITQTTVTTTSSSTTSSSTKTRTTTTTTTTDTPITLFCFAVIRAMSYEIKLLRNAYQSNVGIFGCNKWTVYSDLATWITNPSRIETVAVPGPPSKYNGLWLNCPVFFRVWAKILQAGHYKQYGWIVKADPDTVLLPDRLRAQISQMSSLDPDAKAYFRNCKVFQSMQGPLEIFSRGAVMAFAEGEEYCKSSINQSYIGEDGFMQHCMDRLKVTPIFQFNLLMDAYCEQRVACNDVTKAAYHPFKDEASYSKCLSDTGVVIA